jgi:hypothetical protein
VGFWKIDRRFDVRKMRGDARSEARCWGRLVLARGGGTQDVAEFFFEAAAVPDGAAPEPFADTFLNVANEKLRHGRDDSMIARARQGGCEMANSANEFQRGWDAALVAVCDWHRAQAKKTLVQAGRSRFPKNLEREAEVHKKCAELVSLLSPDDV